MRMMTKVFGIAVALGALTAGVNAQTPGFVGAGSSALFLELGEAAGTATNVTPAGAGAVCVWSQKGGKSTSLTVTDTATESGQAWIAWTPGTTNQASTCGTIGTSTAIYAYVQLDSVLGNRLYFNGGKLGDVSASPAGVATDNLIHNADNTIVEQATLPTAIWTALSGKALTAAGTDIRPEDAKFATLRANTDCGIAVSGSQYLGLGYAFGTSVVSYYNSTNTFHVNNFTLPSSGYTVLSVGATPIIFAVNPGNSSGFGTGVSNISKATLARFLEGQYGSTSEVSGAAGAAPVTVLIREPLSGTYNTVEYAVPNTISNQNSQEAGNCNGTVPKTNPLHLATSDTTGSYRNRVIGTGESVSELLATQDALGYAFWSTGNFANATSANARYLTVDGYDPLYDPSGSSYSTIKNTIPTVGNGYLTDVTFTDLNNGDYPVWSMLRLVTATSGANYNYANKLAQAAQNFVPVSTHPDFVKASTLAVVHSHFAPPGVTTTPNNGGTCGTEAGGDVAGVILALNTCTTGQRQ